MKKTAKERAEELVRVEQYHTSNSYTILVGSHEDGDVECILQHQDAAEGDAKRLRASLAAALELHAQEAISPPFSGGISDERLAEIRHQWETWDIRQDRQKAIAHVNDLLAHIDHLSAILRDAGEEYGEELLRGEYRRGFEAGAEAMRHKILTGSKNARRPRV